MRPCFPQQSYEDSVRPSTRGSWGGYAFDFATRKFIGPDDPAIMGPPPGGWGGDEGADWGVIDPVTDELVRARSSSRCLLRAGRPFVVTSHNRGAEPPSTKWGNHQPAARVRRIGLRMAWGTERHQAVEIEVRAALGALDDLVDVQPRAEEHILTS